MMDGTERQHIVDVVRGLDRWLDSTRVDWPSPGYGGPVIHWWNHSLAYVGAGFDWRYEGIVAGYLEFWSKTGDDVWLDKAIRAGEDMCAAQTSDGHFLASRFEQNPGAGGTPHEAAADVALLLLARALTRVDSDNAHRYLTAARSNLESFWLGCLWDERTGTLRDDPATSSFVPNKAATFIDAILLIAELTGESALIDRYACRTGDAILRLQVTVRGDNLDGAIAQNEYRGERVDAYFPIYIARCIPPLLSLSQVTGDRRYRDGALRAARFLERVRHADGGCPQVLYPRGRQNRYPRWIAGSGDVLRALMDVNRAGAEIDITSTVRWILRGARSDGRIATAEGFGRILPLIGRRERFADEIGVVGWCDKAFRALTMLVPSTDSRRDAEQRDVVERLATGRAR